MGIEVKNIAALEGHTGCIYAMDQGISTHTVFTGGGDKFIALGI